MVTSYQFNIFYSLHITQAPKVITERNLCPHPLHCRWGLPTGGSIAQITPQITRIWLLLSLSQEHLHRTQCSHTRPQRAFCFLSEDFRKKTNPPNAHFNSMFGTIKCSAVNLNPHVLFCLFVLPRQHSVCCGGNFRANFNSKQQQQTNGEGGLQIFSKNFLWVRSLSFNSLFTRFPSCESR